MALLQVNTFSQALSRIITFHIILPNDAPPEMLAGNSNYDRPMKTLYLLHGFSGSTQDWLTGSLIQELALKYNLAVVMPAGENSFYLNGKGTGRGYETFTAVELPAYCQKTFGLSDKPEDNFIGGVRSRWIIQRIALVNWEMTVASAAAPTPIPRPPMKSRSSTTLMHDDTIR